MNAETIQGTDLEIIEALDFEESDACEFRSRPCSEKATTLIVHNCCGQSYQLCVRHTTGLLEYLMVAKQHHRTVSCRACLDPDAPFPMLVPVGAS